MSSLNTLQTTQSQTIAIIDYGMGNLHSAAKAVKKVAPNANVIVSGKPKDIENADRIILPGVGAMRDCMGAIIERNLVKAITHAWNNKPFLGICIGMQALLDKSDESNGVDCLGLIEGTVKIFPDSVLNKGLKVPHMGWNQVQQTKQHPLWNNIDNNARFYFVHSFIVAPTNHEVTTGLCEHGIPFPAAIGQDNVFAVQFHPEKSQKTGLQLLKNFTQWIP